MNGQSCATPNGAPCWFETLTTSAAPSIDLCVPTDSDVNVRIGGNLSIGNCEGFDRKCVRQDNVIQSKTTCPDGFTDVQKQPESKLWDVTVICHADKRV